MTSLWRMAPLDGLAWHAWDGDVVLFVAATGETHALGQAASVIFETMLREAEAARSAEMWIDAGCDDLGGATADDLAGDSADIERTQAEQLLLGLESIGAVARHSH